MENEIETLAREILNGLEDAAGDMGFSFHPMFCNKRALARWNEMKDEGISIEYRKDAMADWFYDDVDSMADLAGDRIFDAACDLASKSEKTRDEYFILIANKAKEITYASSIKKAMDKLIERRMQK